MVVCLWASPAGTEQEDAGGGVEAAGDVVVIAFDVEADAGVDVEADAEADIEADAVVDVEADAVVDVEADAGVDVEADVPKDDVPEGDVPEGGAADAPADLCAAVTSCDDGNACTTDGCDPLVGCTNEASAGPCDDGDACTEGDACQPDGTCTGKQKVCPDDGTICTNDVCDKLKGCIYVPIVHACDDGNACTANDQCVAGTCSGGDEADCSDANACTDDACDPKAGCVHEPNANACEDGNLCTVGDVCLNGVCVAVDLTDCNDGNPCTGDSCAGSDVGCKHDVAAMKGVACDDGDACTAGEACDGKGACGGAKAVGCDDGDACTADLCDAATGCTHAPLPGGAPCVPADACAAAGACAAGKCVATGPKLFGAVYGGIGTERAYALSALGDAAPGGPGFAWAGYASSTDLPGGQASKGSNDVWLVRTDAQGSLLWNRTFGGSQSDAALAMTALGDTAPGGAGFAMAGYADSTDLPGGQASKGAHDFWLVRTDAQGNLLWNRTFGGSQNDVAYAMTALGDTAPGGAGFAMAGSAYSTDLPGGQASKGSYDFWLVRTDAQGNLLWNRTFGGSQDDMASALAPLGDAAPGGAGFALAGWTDSTDLPGGQASEGKDDFWLVRTDALGNLLWSRTFGGTKDDYPNALTPLPDTAPGGAGFALAGYTTSTDLPGGQASKGNFDFWLVRTDAQGNLLWSRTFGGTGVDYARALTPLADGGFALAGWTDSTDLPGGQASKGAHDFWLVRTDALGNLLWSRTFGGTGGDLAVALAPLPDGGFALAGATQSTDLPGGLKSAGDYDAWLLRLDAFGNATCAASGACVALSPSSPPPEGCDDGNACTADLCDAATGCTHAPLPAGAPCGTGKVCDGKGACVDV